MLSDASLNIPSSKDASESRCCRKQRHGVLVAESLITAGDFRKYVGDCRETEVVDTRRPLILRTPQLQLLYLVLQFEAAQCGLLSCRSPL